MDALDYFKILLGRWRIVVTISLVFSLGGFVIAMASPRTYGAYTAFFITTPASPGNSGLPDSNAFVQARMKSYTALVTTPQVLEPVLASAHVDLSMTELADSITVESPIDTVILAVKVTQHDPQVTLALSRAIASVLPTALEGLERGGSRTSPVSVKVVTPPALGPEPESPRPKRTVALAAGIGALVGMLGAFLMHLRQQTSKPSRKED